MEIADSYRGLREQVFSLASGKVKGLSATKEGIYAVLMETSYPDATFTLVAVSDGAASLYFSNGGGIIGAGEHDLVRKEVFSLLSGVPEYLRQSENTSKTQLPKQDHTSFYFVTNKGVYTMDALEDDLGNNKHKFSPLFHQAHALITAIRQVDEMRSKMPQK